MRRVSRIGGWMIAAAGLAGAATPDPSAVRFPGTAPPAIVERLGALDGLAAFAVAPEGRAAAMALAVPGERGRSLLRVLEATDPTAREVEIPGLVRALLFTGRDLDLLALVHRPSKNLSGETYLVRIDPRTLKQRREVRVPPSAAALDRWVERDVLLLVAEDEVRTFFLPDLRSGPLHRVPGRNLAVASLGGPLTLVGQDDELLLIDLTDRPGAEQLAPRERLAVPRPVAQLAAARDDERALVKLDDGSLFDLRLDPLRLEGAGTAAAVAIVPPPPPEQVETEPLAWTPHTEPAPPPAPALAAAPAEPARPTAAAPQAPPGTEVPAAPRATSTLPAPPATSIPPGGPAATATATPPGTLRGRIVGEGIALVAAVVLLGPNNILREAARVQPAEDGTWSASGLPPGRYRIQLDGGPARALATQPPFSTIELAAGATLDAPEFRVVGQW